MRDIAKWRGKVWLMIAILLCLAATVTYAVRADEEDGTSTFSLDSDAYGQPYDGVDFDELLTGYKTVYYGVIGSGISDNYYGNSGKTDAPLAWHAMGEDTAGTIAIMSRYFTCSSIWSTQTTINYTRYDYSTVCSWMRGSLLTGWTTTEKGSLSKEPVTVKLRNSSTDAEITGTKHPAYSTSYSSPAPWTLSEINSMVYSPWASYKTKKAYWSSLDGDTEGKQIPTELLKMPYRTSSNYKQYWTRNAATTAISSVLIVNELGGFPVQTRLDTRLGARPITRIKADKILYVTPIVKVASGAPGEIVGGTASWGEYIADDVYPTVKLTLLNEDITIDAVTYSGSALNNGDSVSVAAGESIELEGSYTGADKLVYKLVDREQGEIVGYAFGDADSIEVSAESLEIGKDYTLYVWAQKDNAINSDEASVPMYFDLEVENPIPTPPVITSSLSVQVLYGTEHTVKITATGIPKVSEFELVGAPEGVTIDNSGNLTVAVNTATGVHQCSVRAKNGVEPYAEETLEILVYDPVKFTGVNTYNVVSGAETVEQLYTTGYPGVLTFTKISGSDKVSVDNSGKLYITSELVEGTYEIVIEAEDSLGYTDTQTVTIIAAAQKAPEFTVALTHTAIFGEQSTFQVTTTAVPNVFNYSLSGAPSGVTIDSNLGTITVGASIDPGEYTFTVHADNGILPSASGETQLTVNKKPVYTGESQYSFLCTTAGTSGTFTIGYDAYPMTVTFTKVSGTSTITVNSTTGVVTLGSTTPVGTYNMIFGINNGVGGVTQVPITVRVISKKFSMSKNAYGQAYDGVDFEDLVGNKRSVYLGYSDNAYLVADERGSIPWVVMGEETEGCITIMTRYRASSGAVSYGTASPLENLNFGVSSLHTWLNSSQVNTTNSYYSGFMSQFGATERDSLYSGAVTTNMRDANGNIITGTAHPMGGSFTSSLPWSVNTKVYTYWVDVKNSIIGWSAEDGLSWAAVPADLKLATARSGGTSGDSCWTRTPCSGSYKVYYINNLGTPTETSPATTNSARPIARLKADSILFASPIVSTVTNNQQTKLTSSYILDATYLPYKLTLLNKSLKVDSLSLGGVSKGSGDDLEITENWKLTLDGSLSGGANKLVYKIVDRTEGDIVGYGTGDASSIEVSSSGLTLDETYTLYVWAQKDNTTISNEGSDPIYLDLTVVTELSDEAPNITTESEIIYHTDSGEGMTLALECSGKPEPTSFTMAPSVTGVSINQSTGVLTIAKTIEPGVYTFSVTVDNGVEPKGVKEFTLHAKKAPEIVEGIESVSAGADTQIQLKTEAVPAIVECSLLNAPSGVSIDDNGIIYVSAGLVPGVHRFSVRMTNADGLSTTEIVTLTSIDYTDESKGRAYDGIDIQGLIGSNSFIYLGDRQQTVIYKAGGTNYPTFLPVPILWTVMGEENNEGALTASLTYFLNPAGKAYNYGSYTSYGNDYSKSEVRTYINSAEYLDALFTAAEKGSLRPVDTVTGIYDNVTGVERTTNKSGDGKTYSSAAPFKTYGDTLYLPWATVGNDKLYWSAGNVASSEYEYNNNTRGATFANVVGTDSIKYSTRSASSSTFDRVITISPYVDTTVPAKKGGRAIADTFIGDNTIGIRPLLKIDYDRIVFAHRIVSSNPNSALGEMAQVNRDNTTMPGWTTTNWLNHTHTSFDILYGPSEQGSYKLTLVSDDMPQVSITSEEGDQPIGSSLKASVTAKTPINVANLGSNKSAYKIVSRESEKVVRYGTGGAALEVNTIGLEEDKEYTLYVWSLKEVTQESNEAGQPMYMTLDFQDTVSSPIILTEGTITAIVKEETKVDVEAAGPGTITYGLEEAPDGVSIQEDTGTLEISGDIPIGEYELVVTADNGTPPMASRSLGLDVIKADVVITPTIDAGVIYSGKVLNLADSIKVTRIDNGEAVTDEVGLEIAAYKMVGENWEPIEASMVKDAASYKFEIKTGEDSDYAGELVYLLEIVPKTLTIKVNDIRIAKGKELPEISIKYIGIAEGDEVENILSQEAIVGYSVLDSSTVGESDIEITKLAVASSSNYILEYSLGKLMVLEEGSGEFSDGNLVGEVIPLQVRALIPTVISFVIDPNEPTNYDGGDGAGFISPPVVMENMTGVCMGVCILEMKPNNEEPAVYSPDKFEDWARLSKEETRKNIAFGFNKINLEQWYEVPDNEGWFNSAEEKLELGKIMPKTVAEIKLKSKYGLSWGNTAEEQLSYKVVYLVTTPG